MSKRITVVVGAPASGKNTYISRRRGEDDVVIDQDALNWACGGGHRKASLAQQKVGFAARSAAVGKVCGEGVDVDAWIIHGNPKPEQVEFYGKAGAKFVVCTPPLEEVLMHAGDDGRDVETARGIIEAWYETPPQIPKKWVKETISSYPSGESKGETMGKQYKDVKASIKAEVENLEEGQFIAYASTFDREPDSYGDVVAKGAFEKTLREWEESGNTIPILFGHRMDDPAFNIGGVVKAVEDERGLKILGQLDLDSEKGAQVYRLIKGRRLAQLSFAFDVLNSGQVTLEDGTKANELREIKLYEVSLVPIGANQNTEIIAVKTALDVVAEGVKAGRSLSAKNETALLDAIHSIESVLASTDPEGDGEEKADSQVADKEGAAKQVNEPVTAALSRSAQSLKQAMVQAQLALTLCRTSTETTI